MVVRSHNITYTTNISYHKALVNEGFDMYMVMEVIGQDSIWHSHYNDYGLYIRHSCHSTFEPKKGDDAYNQQFE